MAGVKDQEREDADDGRKHYKKLRGWTMSYIPEVDVEKCIGCGECVDVCPVDVYEIQNEKSVPANADECIGCESCVEVCDQEAITINEI